MGYVARAHTQTGAQLATDLRGTRVQLDVARLPFVAHRYFKPKEQQ